MVTAYMTDTWIHYIFYYGFIFLPLPRTHRPVHGCVLVSLFWSFVKSSWKFELQSKKEGGKITKYREKNNYKEANNLTGNLPLFVHLDQYFLFLILQKNPLLWQHITIISFITEMYSCSGEKHNCTLIWRLFDFCELPLIRWIGLNAFSSEA